MKENYRAWKISRGQFYRLKSERERLKFLLGYAILAPSTHNSQPWKFKLDGKKVEIKADYTKALVESDEGNRFLYFSLGCALQNLLVAADYYGYKTRVQYSNRGKDGRVVRVSFREPRRWQKRRKSNHQLHLINRRFTDRVEYSGKWPDRRVLAKVEKLSGAEVGVCFTDREDVGEVLEIARESVAVVARRRLFQKELAVYLKSNLTNSGLGMPGFVSGFPTPVSFVTSYMMKHFNLGILIIKNDEKLIEKTRVFGVVSSKRDDQISWVKGGQLYQQVALELTRCELSVQPMASVGQVKNCWKRLGGVMGVKARVQILFRVGYGRKKPLHTPRLRIDEVIEYV